MTGTGTAVETTDIAADDPNIQYIGRFDLTAAASPAFDWSYCCISAKFQGTSCSVKLGGTSKYFDLYVDGVKTGSIKSANGGLETLPVASGLADGVHSVALYRRDEASKGLNTFQGFVLDTGKALVAPDARPCRKLEFIGDSFTCGYGGQACCLLPQFLGIYQYSFAIPCRSLWSKSNVMTLISSQALLNYLEQTTERHIQKAIEDYQNMDAARLLEPARNGAWSIAQCLVSDSVRLS